MQNIDNSRDEDQKRKMVLLQEKGLCMFCEEGFTFLGKEKIFEGKTWYVTKNDYPYTGSAHHIMAVPIRHLESPEAFTATELFELCSIVIPFLKTDLGMQGFGCFFRFGDTKKTGATQQHLHLHFVEGVDRESKDHPPIFAVVGFQKS